MNAQNNEWEEPPVELLIFKKQHHFFDDNVTCSIIYVTIAELKWDVES